jgi:hypothetical protein
MGRSPVGHFCTNWTENEDSTVTIKGNSFNTIENFFFTDIQLTTGRWYFEVTCAIPTNAEEMLLEVGWADDNLYAMNGGCKYVLSARVMTEAERSVTVGCCINIRANSRGPEIRFYTDGSMTKTSTLTPEMHDWKWLTPVISHRGGHQITITVNLGSAPFKHLSSVGKRHYRGVWDFVRDRRLAAASRTLYRPDSCIARNEVEQVFIFLDPRLSLFDSVLISFARCFLNRFSLQVNICLILPLCLLGYL